MYRYEATTGLVGVLERVIAEDMEHACELLDLNVDDLSGSERLGYCEGQDIVCVGEEADFEEE